MCQYCWEDTAVNIAEALASGKTWKPELENRAFFSSFYFQECIDLALALKQKENELKEVLSRPKREGEGALNPDGVLLCTVFCCIMEALVKYGFDSAEYRSLIDHRLTREIIENQTHSTLSLDKRFFGSKSVFQTLFNRDTFLVKEQWLEVLNHPLLVKECIDLLSAYIEWWHLGKELRTETEEEDNVFQEVFPYVFFGFVLLASQRPQHEAITQLVKTDPKSATFFGIMDLWLQRKASLIVYNSAGLTAFVPYGKAARPALIYYLVIKHKLKVSEKATLREAVLQSGRFIPDNPFRKSNELPFYLYVESEIMERI
jgi:hypothetical protein